MASGVKQEPGLKPETQEAAKPDSVYAHAFAQLMSNIEVGSGCSSDDMYTYFKQSALKTDRDAGSMLTNFLMDAPLLTSEVIPVYLLCFSSP